MTTEYRDPAAVYGPMQGVPGTEKSTQVVEASPGYEKPYCLKIELSSYGDGLTCTKALYVGAQNDPDKLSDLISEMIWRLDCARNASRGTMPQSDGTKGSEPYVVEVPKLTTPVTTPTVEQS